MPPWCAVPGCTATIIGRRFFRFPKNEEIKNIWLDILEMKDKKESSSKLRVCDTHFDPEDIIPPPYPGSSARGLRPNSRPRSLGTQNSSKILSERLESINTIETDSTQVLTERIESDNTITATTNVCTIGETNLEIPHQVDVEVIPTSRLAVQDKKFCNDPVNSERKLTPQHKKLQQMKIRINNITRRIHGQKKITGIMNSGERLAIVTTKLSLEERRKIAAWMEVFQSLTLVRRKYKEYFNSDPPSKLAINRIYNKFVKTGSVASDLKESSINNNDDQIQIL